VTTRRLVIIRHGKAAAVQADDAARPLEPRGKRDATAAGRWLADAGLAPERIVMSPTRRTQQTWALAAAALVDPPVPETDSRIYDNTVDDLLTLLRETPPDMGTVALVGHSPAVQELALLLDDGRGAAAGRRELAGKYPTSAIAVFILRTDWAALGVGTATLQSFAVPRG